MSETTAQGDPDDEGNVRLVGTAHVSEESAERAREAIEEEQPDMVAVELDKGRLKRLKGEDPDEIDPKELLGGSTAFQFLAYWLLSYVQAQLGEKFDVDPGADMKAAVDAAEDRGIPVALVDRDIHVTVQRFWQGLGFGEKFELVSTLLARSDEPRDIGISVGFGVSLAAALFLSILGGPYLVPSGIASGAVVGFLVAVVDFFLVAFALGAFLAVGIYGYLALRRRGREEVEGLDAIDDFNDIDDIERLTDTDVVTAMMAEFRRFSPGGAEALIDERDAYIAHKLVALRKQGHDVVAVVGAGHEAGIRNYLDDPDSLPEMEQLAGSQSKRRRFSPYRALGYLFTLGFALFFALLAIAAFTGVEGASTELLVSLFGAWFLVNAAFSFGLAKLAGARWSSAAVGGSVAWLTSVNPMLAPGWFAGYAELRHLEINVSDISKMNDAISEEVESFRELWSELTDIDLFRLIAVVAGTNIGSFVASMLFITVIAPFLFAGAGIESVGDIGHLLIQAATNGAEVVIDATKSVL